MNLHATEAPPNAVQTTEQPSNPGIIDITELAGRGDVVRLETVIALPKSFQYVIPVNKKVGDQWHLDPSKTKVGITSDGYDYLNRYLGVSFFTPDWVPDDKGDLVRNPIHRSSDGYIFRRMGAVWYNEAGQLVAAYEDLEVNPAAIYAAARVSAREAVPLLKDGLPVFENGFPVVQMTGGKNAGENMRADKKALDAFMSARSTNGMRYAQTVLRVRLIKVALGIKSLPGFEAKDRKVRVVAYRDKMDPMARQAAAETAMERMFGGVAPRGDAMLTEEESRPLTDAEMAVIEAPGEEEATEAVLMGEPGDPGPDEFDPDGR